MHIDLPFAVVTALNKLNTAGFAAYVVGGCVRDSLMGRLPYDWDITTSATPQEMAFVFTDYRTIETGLKHGTLTVIVDETPLEITTFRLEGAYSDGRHPDSVSFSQCLSDDLQRRDFTVNAMAYHPNTGLIDLYDGQGDLQNATVRCVGNPDTRLEEDALRIIRALRFAAVLDFRIDSATDAALRRLSPTLNEVSVERITAELTKLLCGKAARRVLRAYADVIRFIIPELAEDSDFHLITAVEAIPIARLAALLWESNISAETAERILIRLRLDNHTIQSVKRLIQCKNMPYSNDKDLLWLLNRLDDNLIWDYLSLAEADDEVRARVKQLLNDGFCYKLSMLAVNGTDLKKIGISDGPEFGSMLHALLQAVMNGDCPNNKHSLLEYANTMKKPVQ